MKRQIKIYFCALITICTISCSRKSTQIIYQDKIVIPSSAEDSNFCKHLEVLRQSIVEHREYIHETNLQNLLDEILSLIDKTCYLLTLK